MANFINEVKGISQLTTNEVTWLSDAVDDSSSSALSWSGIVATLSEQTITGTSGSETLNGTRWDDNINALAGNNIVNGGDGNDSLQSSTGSDILNGGSGNDILRGGSGNDIYIYDSGHDVIAEDFNNFTTSTDTIQFGAGIAVGDVTLHIAQMIANVSTWHIFLEIAGRGTLTIDTPSGGSGPFTKIVDTLVFADSTTFNIATMDVTFHGQVGDDYINTANWATTGDQFVYGYGGDDRIDLIGTQPIQVDAGEGKDLIYGSVNNDTFVVSPGGDQFVGGGGTNTILLPSGYSAGDVTYYRYEDISTPYSSPKTWDALITVAGLGSITVLRQFEGDTDSIIQTLKFSDGSTVNLLTQEYVTFGTSGDDTYDNVGSLWANKNDVYLFGQGDDIVQEDTGTDTILFAAGLNLSNITVQKRDTGSHFSTTKFLVIEDGNGNTLTFKGHFDNNAYKAENLKFNDGSIISISSLEIDSHGSGGDDRLDGIVAGSDLTTNDVMYGHGGADQIYAGAGNDVSYGGTGNDYIFDDAGNDTLYGEDGDDQLYGYSGNDTLYGGIGTDILRGDDTFASSSITGNDFLYGGDGNDNLSGGRGNDLLDGGAGDDVLSGDNDTDTVAYASSTAGVTVSLALTSAQNTIGAGTDTITNTENLTGSAFNDVLTGDASANTLTGSDGNDVLEGLAGNDTLDGGNGSDTASYANATAAVTVNLATTTAQNTVGAGTDTLVSIENAKGSAFNDTLTGSSGSNVIEGGAGNDTLNGAAGTDTLSYVSVASAVTVNLATTTVQATGGAGSDTVSNFENLTGSAFNDTLTGNTGNNVIEGGAGNDAINGSTGTDTASYENATAAVTVSLALTTAQNTLGAGTDTLTAMEHLRGSAFNDTLTGSSTDNTIEGGAGDDTMNAGSGSDTLLYASATSGITVSLALTTAQNTGGAGTDTISNFEKITGSAFADVLTGNSAANTLDGGLGDDILDGGAGNDTLNGNTGTDTASYASATAAVTVSLALTTAQNTVAAGSDTITNTENLTGSGFNDTLTGNTGINILTGGAGNDTLRGGAGNDALKGGLGTDTLYGEADADLFVFEAASAFTAQDTVADFSIAQGDKLNIADLLIGYTAGQSAIDDFVTFTTAGANTNFAVDRDGTGTTYSAITIASITGVTGLDADTLLNNGNLIAV
ncbi:MAG: type I secretion C-terminal target domain-containing protein [Alphaproteobacteria bacterium]|nr:MAG: type I secretion C-terminal target domain-containing protein [Alphaproteobacteria bacterium]